MTTAQQTVTLGRPVVFLCLDCELPVATLKNGVLYIVSRHHGEHHTTGIPVTSLDTKVWAKVV